MKYFFVQKMYLDPSNISYSYTTNYYKSIKALGNIDMVKLSDIAVEITDGTRVKRNYIDHGVKIINVGDFKGGTIYSETIKSIPKDRLKDKDYIRSNDLLITAVGKSGQVTRVTPNLEDYIISSDIIRIRLKQPSEAERLVAYFRSESGQYALEAIKTGQLNRISINDIKELQIPVNYREISLNKDGLIERKKEVYKLYEECVELFEKYVAQEESLFNSPQMVYIKASKIKTDRLDPKYYTYFETGLYKVINSSYNNVTWIPLGKLVEIKKAIRPTMDENQEVNYINISNLDSDLSVITSNEKALYKDLSSRIRYVLNQNEIITAKSGSSTGTENHVTAIVTNRYKNMMASDAFYNIKPIQVNPYYLLFLFKQPIILKQIEAGCTGSYFKTINRNEFEEIRIPRLDDFIELQIVQKMVQYLGYFEEYKM
ncbi:hypothetical protein [Clostridium kluyveri]|uniref:hypothetical protein n=1 Tax=Clostridium kluyveri TaxID=1534 RepID=UPI002247ED93|nr:hypothetical protein [Clostridium kluyveri]UZQ52415.1 hypothetical protein OP486_09735 [Clostridium kluyveri]